MFQLQLKMDYYEDDTNSKISKLLRFFSTTPEDREIGLDKFLDRFQECQVTIYVMSGDKIEAMKKQGSPFRCSRENLEVLMFESHLDEHRFQKLADYERKKVVSIQRAALSL